MPAARILADANGHLSVPDEPIIPVVAGDGAGLEAWRLARHAVDKALEKAYGAKRRLHWLEFPAGERAQRELNDRIPPATVNAFRMYRVGINGGQRTAALETGPTFAGELRALLDLHVQVVALRRPPTISPVIPGLSASLALALDLGEGSTAMLELPAGSSRSMMLLERLETDVPSALAPLRFATVSAVNAWAQLREEPPPGAVDAAVALQPASTVGTQRLVRAAMAFARRFGLKSVVFAHDSEDRTQLSLARKMAARFAWDALEPAGRVPLEFRRAAMLPGEAAALGTALVAAPEAEGRRLVQALAPAFGGASVAATGAYNLDSGHAVFGPLSGAFDAPAVLPLVGAGRLLLLHLGWDEAARALDAATAKVLGAGRLPPEVAGPAGLAPAVFAAELASAFA